MADWGDATHTPPYRRDNQYPDTFDLILFIALNFLPFKSTSSTEYFLCLCVVQWQTSEAALRSILWH